MKTAQFARLRAVAAVIAVLAASTPAAKLRAATWLVPSGWEQFPSGWEHFDGNTDSGGPFNIGAFGLSSFRTQQVYSTWTFSRLPMTISQIAFRPDAVRGAAFESTLPNVQISLSTTHRGVNDLSLTFADNVGPNETIVHSGPLALASSFTGPAGGPMDFDIVIDLAEPFVYDPRQGHLLMDVRNYGGGVTTQFDSVGDPNGAVSWVVDHTDADAPVASLGGGPIGLVTRFTYEYAEQIKEYKYVFTGEIDQVDDELNWFNDSFAVGMPVKGTFNLFDPGFQYGGTEDGSHGSFNFSKRWPNSYGLPPLPMRVAVEIDGQTYEQIVEPWNLDYSVQLSNDHPGPGPGGPGDVYGIRSQMEIPPHFVDGAQEIENYRPFGLLGLTFVDSTGTAFEPLYPSASPELIVLNPARYDSLFGGISILDFNDFGNGYMPGVRFQITSLRLVPEPGGLALASGALAMFLVRRRRTCATAGSPSNTKRVLGAHCWTSQQWHIALAIRFLEITRRASAAVTLLAVSVGTAACAQASWTVTSFQLLPVRGQGLLVLDFHAGQQVGVVYGGEWNHASLWSGTADSWVDLHPSRAAFSQANSLDAEQQVGAVVISLGEMGHASLWSGTAESWVDLHPVGAEMSRAYDVHAGWQVGEVQFDGLPRASLWNGTAESWEDLSLVLGDSWPFAEPRSIWSDATTLFIAGTSFNQDTGRTEAFLLTRSIPEPGSFVLASGAVVLVVLRRRTGGADV